MNGRVDLDSLLRQVNCYPNIQRVRTDVIACIAQVCLFPTQDVPPSFFYPSNCSNACYIHPIFLRWLCFPQSRYRYLGVIQAFTSRQENFLPFESNDDACPSLLLYVYFYAPRYSVRLLFFNMYIDIYNAGPHPDPKS